MPSIRLACTLVTLALSAPLAAVEVGADEVNGEEKLA